MIPITHLESRLLSTVVDSNQAMLDRTLLVKVCIASSTLVQYV